jgi:NAD+ kinase
VSRAGFVVHPGRPRAREVAAGLIEWLRGRGDTSVSLPDESIGADEVAEPARFADGLDVVVSVGGDGTLLRAADLARPADVPVLGVNVGRLGFLTAVEPEEAEALLERALAGSAPVEERMAIEAHPEAAPWEGTVWALNEVMVEKHARHRLISLALYVDDEYVTSLSADGVIVATPTGSTAYSFSARGPIVTPKLSCLLLTPVSPHMVFDRPIVLDPREEVVVEVRGEEPGYASADGRPGLELPVGARLRIRRAERPARLVRAPDATSFYSLVREKFDLPVDVRVQPPEA